LVFDPFDLTRIDVRFQNRSMGGGVPQHIGRHPDALVTRGPIIST
jgi:hypothetical protein